MAESDCDRVWKRAKDVGFCMLSTIDGDQIDSRPMAAYVRPEEERIYFLTDKGSAKEEEIARNANVNLAFADAGDQTYVSIRGRASLSNDRDKIRDLWSPPAKAWWDGPDDPSIRLLTVEPTEAQYWDSPGTVASYIKMAAAFVSDARLAVGDHAKVDM